MAKNFEVSVSKERITENAESTMATNIEAVLDALNIGTDHEVYAITVFKHQGFLWVVVIYEP